MLSSISESRELSKAYDIPPEDIQLISLNASCMQSDLPYKRVRFKLEVDSKPGTVFYFGVPILKSDTPFYLSDKEKLLLFRNQKFGRVIDTENDTCDTSYFRRNDTALNLNPNSRSLCEGCAPCATHRQDATDHYPIDSEEKLDKYLNELFTVPKKYGSARPHFNKPSLPAKSFDFSKLHEVAIVTGCFDSEKSAIANIEIIDKYFRKNHFNGELTYIGSEITSKEGLSELANEIPNFNLCLSLECFTRREQLLKSFKAKLTMDDFKNILGTAKDLGISTNFTYIVGLDPLDEMKKGLIELVPMVGRLPIFQVFQPHFEEQKSLRNQEANYIDYYLKARKNIEGVFSDSNFRPNPWENYRSLWYYSFGNEPLDGIRI